MRDRAQRFEQGAAASDVHRTTGFDSTSQIPIIPMDVRLQVADLAGIQGKGREQFCDCIQMPIHLIWATFIPHVTPGLENAAKAARTLHEVFTNLNMNERGWVEEVWDKTQYKHAIPGLSSTIHALSDIFSIATSQAMLARNSTRHNGRGRRKGAISNLQFRELLHWVLVLITEYGGTVRFDKNYPDKGNLLKIIKILSQYLPPDVVPRPLPLGTIQRAINKPTEYIGYPVIEF